MTSRPKKATPWFYLETIRLDGRRVFTAALILAVVLISGALLSTAGHAAQVMPDFATASDWVIDRYAPHSFSDVGTYNGRNNVLGIEINEAEGYYNRPLADQRTFCDTQGRDYPILGGIPGSVLSADLYIPASWGNTANGSVRTDMWGVMTDGTSINSDYAIFGFTNYGGARYQVYDGNAGGWQTIATPVTYNAWNSLTIKFTGTSYIFSINGTTVYTDTSINGSTAFSWVDMQAYNFFGDPNPILAGANPVNYTAYWSNTPAPIPGSLLLLASGLFGLGLLNWRKIFHR